MVQKHRLMALVKDPDNSEELMNIYLDECHSWDTNKQRRIVYHHINGLSYVSVHVLDDFDESQEIYDIGAMRLDQSNFVNTNFITDYDKNRGEVFFGPDRKQVASFARSHTMIVKDIIRRRGVLSKS